MEPMNILLKTCCRQCRAALRPKAENCPLCGLAQPNYEDLNAFEKEFLKNNPLIPAKHQGMCETVDPRHSLAANMKTELGAYLAGMAQNPFLLASILAFIICGPMWMVGVAFPLSFMLFWAATVYLSYDAVSFFRGVTNAYLIKRLQMKRGLAPYAVHFKLEKQVEKLLESLRSVAGSVFSRNWTTESKELKNTAASFLTAVQVMTERLRKYAFVSLETSAVIWRNQVYSLLAMDSTPQDKALAIGNKIREAESLLLRFKWLAGLQDLHGILAEFIEAKGAMGPIGSTPYGTAILEQFHLSHFGPLEEDIDTGFEHVPFDLSFKGRSYWHKRLPPFALENDGTFGTSRQVNDFFESLQQVIQLKAHLEDQMVLNCVSNALSQATPADGVTREAHDVVNNPAAQYLELPRFRPDSKEVQEQVDRLAAEARVALGSEAGME